MPPEGSPERLHKRAKMDQGNRGVGEQLSSRSSKKKSKYRAQAAKDPSFLQGKSNKRQTAQISASGIHNDDVGIFVSSDKGQERKCLQEISDVLNEYVDMNGKQPDENAPSNQETPNGDIEGDILAELDDLRAESGSKSSAPKFSLVTLDIPCVSFVRFPSRAETGLDLDPVEIVHNICVSASKKDSTGPRSRYIKRLTPVSLIRKTMPNGLESLCDRILPAHFLIQPESVGETQSGPAPGETTTNTPVKFAIRPTIRNNNKVDRDHVIQTVANKINALGQSQHTVDLKGYDKLVLVDVYRNVVGMSVVGSDYEKLKRFNLAELHSSHFDEHKPEHHGEQTDPAA
ncbi:hypothetical protein HRR83_007375 [Exophiala dermatitidis]|uniref:THUMP domain-containing protein n=1 Tax=Exophiala dermatitidis (strain ATCC 34100 / CBS 525.76 / NIH/UT8656) TaxID=858893 RepID=H6C1W5_EXODN|nr:uncharacterized protein HMPREF1120_06656 [Exophiala dermatitidis NIH/UT8656]KAJ4510349.1 hypothetical protein HRR74_006821 [Exophiala dermatitidis]EHY58652.1 hypothetical protein HMPREF1120_06656 [Exophiala dermatitidis NIH/UT8656]KAJ4510716.1 hypothetical protein HRR73_006788 [Exophiala dermatitidis]KAJ4534957.1 hypothetical protein HRR76_006859 [Exophiala dermatitidis]KAJ4536026.1 hypothetical protein HRR77_007472 [Exophiala dermatitidis]